MALDGWERAPRLRALRAPPRGVSVEPWIAGLPDLEWLSTIDAPKGALPGLHTLALRTRNATVLPALPALRALSTWSLPDAVDLPALETLSIGLVAHTRWLPRLPGLTRLWLRGAGRTAPDLAGLLACRCLRRLVLDLSPPGTEASPPPLTLAPLLGPHADRLAELPLEWLGVGSVVPFAHPAVRTLRLLREEPPDAARLAALYPRLETVLVDGATAEAVRILTLERAAEGPPRLEPRPGDADGWVPTALRWWECPTV
jgi:hypothetical protein